MKMERKMAFAARDEAARRARTRPLSEWMQVDLIRAGDKGERLSRPLWAAAIAMSVPVEDRSNRRSGPAEQGNQQAPSQLEGVLFRAESSI
jgi:hypothetical protein